MNDRDLAERPIPPATQRVRDVYHRVAPFYDAFRVAWSRLTLPIERELDRLFRERIGPEARILELAPGTGINVMRLLRESAVRCATTCVSPIETPDSRDGM